MQSAIVCVDDEFEMRGCFYLRFPVGPYAFEPVVFLVANPDVRLFLFSLKTIVQSPFGCFAMAPLLT